MKKIFKVSTNKWIGFDFTTDEYFIVTNPSEAFYVDADAADAFSQEWLENRVGIRFDCFELEELN